MKTDILVGGMVVVLGVSGFVGGLIYAATTGREDRARDARQKALTSVAYRIADTNRNYILEPTELRAACIGMNLMERDDMGFPAAMEDRVQCASNEVLEKYVSGHRQQ